MKPSRRSALGSVAGIPLALAQRRENSLSVTSTSGFRMEQHGDLQRPAVAVFLPSSRYPNAIIEMPEHAWRKEKDAADEPTWFYMMRTSDTMLAGQVEWAGSANTLSFEMKTPSGFTLQGKALLQDDGVAIEYEIASRSLLNVAAAQAVTCVKLYRPFTDVFLDRTYVHLPNGLELIAADSPERIRQNAEEWLPCRYIARVGKNVPATAYRVERLDGVTRHFKANAADVPFIATESEPRGWTACTHTLSADSVFTNPARTCHHADPLALGFTNGRARLQLKVDFVKGTPADAYDTVAKRAAAGRR